MKNISTRFSWVLAVAILAGCAAPQDTAQSEQQAATTSQGSSSVETTATGNDPIMNLDTMCALNKRLNAASPEERKALLDEHMKGMSPESRVRHMDMMAAQCK